MNLHFQLKSILLIGVFFFLASTSGVAQCNFSSQLERLEYAAIKAIYTANPNNTLSDEWERLANNQICNVCLIPETYCNEYGQLKGLSIARKNISKLPREIVALSELQFFDFQNNNLSCLPIEANALCTADPFGEVLEGNPINNLINWSDFCANPRDICLPTLIPLSACEDLAFINYLDTLIILGLGDGYNKVEVIGAPTNWKIAEICQFCPSPQLIADLPEGDYTVKVNTSTQNGEHCYREEKISISKNDDALPPSPPTSNRGDLNCHNLLFFGGYGQIEVDGLTAYDNKVEIIGQATNWKTEILCNGNCNKYEIWSEIPPGSYTIKVNQADRNRNYCYREERVTVIKEDDTPLPFPENNDISCEFITFRGSANQIYIDGLTAEYNKVEYIGAGTNWKVKTFCDGNCYSDERVFDLPAGSYKVKVNQRGIDGKYCYREELVQVSRGNLDRNSLSNQGDLVVFPNPARDQLNLTMSDLEEPVQLRIHNALGHLVKTIPKQNIGTGISIDLTDFENGLYLLSVFKNQSRVSTKRFLVEHLR